MKSPEWASATVGQQGLRVPRVGLGTGLHGEVSEAQSVATIEHALGCGVRFFDTAPLYGNGLAEERLASPCAAYRVTAMSSTPRWASCPVV